MTNGLTIEEALAKTMSDYEGALTRLAKGEDDDEEKNSSSNTTSSSPKNN